MKKRWFLFLLFSAALAARTTLVDLDGVFASPRATALGMSGAAEARAEDIFLNQFGLAGLQNFGFYGSSYRLYDDTNYLNGVLYFPAGPVGLGVGYRLRAVNDVLLTPPDMFGTDGRLDLDRIERVNYQQSALHLSAGYRLEHFLGWQALDLGLAYKSYTVQNSAADLDSLTAQGSNVDLGFLARVNDLWRWSLIGRNVVNGDGVQGSLVWRSGTAEQMVRSVVLGNRLAFNENRLIFLLDVNYYAEDYAPVLLNAGAEGRINNFLALRGGLRQYTLLTGGGEQRVFTAVSAGFGLNPWRGIQLDYAYYPGDDLGLEALHYAGLGLDITELTAPRPLPAPPPETAEMPRTFQISAPANYFVADSAELLCAGQTRGYASFNINSENYTLEPKNFTVTYDLQAGHNVLNIWTDDGTVRLKRQILRLRTLAELQEQGLAADLAQSVFAPEQRRDFRDSKISLSDFAAYAVQTLGLRLPQDFDGIFNDTDILYFNGYLGKTSGGLLNAGSGYFSLGRLAEMLARIDGYGDVLDSADDGRVKAVEILAATGYYTPEDFQPADGEVTLAQAQSLLLRTSAVNRRLAEEFPGYPLVWLDRAELAKGRVVLRLYNAGLLAGYKWTYGRQSVSGSISAEEQINIAPEISAAGTLNIEVYDKPGKVWRFQTALAPLPKDALFLVRAEPRRPEAGLPLKLLFAVPDGLAADSIKLSADIISNIVSLKRVSGNLWQTETRLPDTLNTGEYILRFTVSAAGTEYEKIYPLNVRGFESADRPDVQTANRKVIAKVSAEKIKPGDTLYIYAGVVAGANPVKEMRIVRPGQADVLAGRYKDRLWRAVISGFAAGRNDYRAVAVFQDGSTAEHSGVFWYEGPSTYKTVPSVPSAVSHNATPPPPAEKPRLNKVYYPVEIMLSPAKPRPGGALQIRAKYAAPEVRDVYAEIQKQVIPLKKNGAVWQAEYTLPEKRQELYIKIYSRDARGNLSMTEKSLAF